MSETLRNLFEISFDVAYLVAIWTLVILMTKRMNAVNPGDKKTAQLIRLSFFLLAAGDTGHVGFRVVAYAMGGLESSMTLFGSKVSLIGIGMLTTAVTVTIFYMIMVHVWQARFNMNMNWFAQLLLLVGVIRLIIIALPGNDWGSAVPPQPMSLYRNLPLMIQGIGVLVLILRDSFKKNDTTFQWVGWMIAVSYAFYTPVILFAQKVPLLGMLMIPKTCAYLAIAFIAYKKLWTKNLKYKVA